MYFVAVPSHVEVAKHVKSRCTYYPPQTMQKLPPRCVNQLVTNRRKISPNCAKSLVEHYVISVVIGWWKHDQQSPGIWELVVSVPRYIQHTWPNTTTYTGTIRSTSCVRLCLNHSTLSASRLSPPPTHKPSQTFSKLPRQTRTNSLSHIYATFTYCPQS